MGPLFVLIGGIILGLGVIVLMDWLAERHDRRARAAHKPH
jgi:hypothetical protein